MAKLTVVFEYPDGPAMIEAKRMFQNGNIPNLVGLAEYDAIAAHDSLFERFLGTKTDNPPLADPGVSQSEESKTGEE